MSVTHLKFEHKIRIRERRGDVKIRGPNALRGSNSHYYKRRREEGDKGKRKGKR